MWIKILIVLLMLILLSLAVIYHDTHSFVVRSYDVDSDKVDRDYCYVFLSDLHGYTYGKDNERLLKAIDEISPDIVLCTGDMLIGHKIDGKIQYQAGLHVLAELAKKYPVYASNGNHEQKIKTFKSVYGEVFEEYRSKLLDAGVIVLENESIEISDMPVRITGLDLGLEYFRKVVKKEMTPGYLQTLIGESSRDKLQLLLAHNPQYFREYADWGADISFAGHVHGGIVRLPFIGGIISPSIALFPKYDGGKYELDGKTMILSRGLGTHTIHVRMFNPGELDVIRIHSKK